MKVTRQELPKAVYLSKVDVGTLFYTMDNKLFIKMSDTHSACIRSRSDNSCYSPYTMDDSQVIPVKEMILKT